MSWFRAICCVLLLPWSALADEPFATGSGIFLGDKGYLLTNEHVVAGCSKVAVTLGTHAEVVAKVIGDAAVDDLALLEVDGLDAPAAAFRDGKPIRPGDPVVVLGFPLAGLLATEAGVTTGSVTALAGVLNDQRYLQISAPVEPGNSGGPLLDSSGDLIGIVSEKLNAAKLARVTHDIAQNVNFAIKASVVRRFLDGLKVHYRLAASDSELSPADVAEHGRAFTAFVLCFHDHGRHGHGGAPDEAAAPGPASMAEASLDLPASPAVGTVFQYHGTIRARRHGSGEADWSDTVTGMSAAAYEVSEASGASVSTGTLDRNPLIGQLAWINPTDAKQPEEVHRKTVTADRGLDRLFPLAEGREASGTLTVADELQSGKTVTHAVTKSCTVGSRYRAKIEPGTYEAWSITCTTTEAAIPSAKIEEKDYYAPALGVLLKQAVKTHIERSAGSTDVVLTDVVPPKGK